MVSLNSEEELGKTWGRSLKGIWGGVRERHTHTPWYSPLGQRSLKATSDGFQKVGNSQFTQGEVGRPSSVRETKGLKLNFMHQRR